MNPESRLGQLYQILNNNVIPKDRQVTWETIVKYGMDKDLVMDDGAHIAPEHEQAYREWRDSLDE